MKRIGLAVLAVALCFTATRPAMAQGTWRYSVNAGLLLPMGDYNTADKMGFVGGAGATYWLPGNIGIRGDLSYSTTSHNNGISGNTKIAGGMASFLYGLMPASAPARVILMGGLGYYNVKVDAGGISGSESKIGFGLGAAVAFKLGKSSTRLVVGSRYTSVSTTGGSTNFLPLTVGFAFGK